MTPKMAVCYPHQSETNQWAMMALADSGSNAEQFPQRQVFLPLGEWRSVLLTSADHLAHWFGEHELADMVFHLVVDRLWDNPEQARATRACFARVAQSIVERLEQMA